MLRSIKINNYKMFRDFEIDFADGINLICGPNGSGKSALREVLFSMTNFLAMPDAAEHMAHSVSETFPFEVFCRWLPQDTGYNEIQIQLILDKNINYEKSSDEIDEYYVYKLTVRYNFAEHKSRVQDESLRFHSHGDKELLSFSNGVIRMTTDDNKTLSFNADWNISGLVTGSRNNSKIRDFGALIAKVIGVHLSPSLIKPDFAKGTSSLDAQGENFLAWNFFNTNSQLERQWPVIQRCKTFIPGFVSANSNISGDRYKCKIRVNYNKNNYDLQFEELSDGQKILFALYSLLANVPDGATLLVDEPENFLSPAEVQPWLDAVNDTWEERGIQFIIISHNPKTLNWHHKEAIIFELSGEPPIISNEKNSNNSVETLYEKLSEMEWTGNGK